MIGVLSAFCLMSPMDQIFPYNIIQLRIFFNTVGTIRIFINGFKFEVQIGNPKNNILIGEYRLKIAIDVVSSTFQCILKWTTTKAQSQTSHKFCYFLLMSVDQTPTISFNGNLFALKGSEKETQISVHSASFATSSESQEFYHDCRYHNIKTRTGVMDDWRDEELVASDSAWKTQ